MSASLLEPAKGAERTSSPLMAELSKALADFEADEEVGCMVLTGSEKAFLAGADIKDADKSFTDVFGQNFITSGWEDLTDCRKPVIAAVAGYAGGL